MALTSMMWTSMMQLVSWAHSPWIKTSPWCLPQFLRKLRETEGFGASNSIFDLGGIGVNFGFVMNR
jgi:hypothetical protein